MPQVQTRLAENDGSLVAPLPVQGTPLGVKSLMQLVMFRQLSISAIAHASELAFPLFQEGFWELGLEVRTDVGIYRLHSCQVARDDGFYGLRSYFVAAIC
jgi:hypothetical protein